MSTIAYAQITNRREAAPPGTSTSASPGLRTYVDALAALVPSEVLTLHALLIAVTTSTVQDTVKGTTTVILPEAVDTLRVAFWGLVAFSLVLYLVPRYMGGTLDRYDALRAVIAPLAFFAWTMLQRTTAFDAAFAWVPPIPRTVAALFMAALLGALTAGLAMKADAKT